MAERRGEPDRKHICDYFEDCYSDAPLSTPPFPERTEDKIVGWLQHRVWERCFVAVFEDGPDWRYYFFCAICSRCRKISTSSAHIRVHFQSESHDERHFLERHKIPRARVAERMCQNLILFLLENGFPFRLIDDSRLSDLPLLPARKQLRSISGLLAQKIWGLLKSILATVEYCTLSLDEWADWKHDRYFGVTCHTMVHGMLKVFTLAHVPINPAIAADGRDHLTALDLARITNSLLTKFGIEKKTLLIVTDHAAVMQAAINLLNEDRVSTGLSPVLWGVCTAHVVNLLLSKFVQLSSNVIGPVVQLQQKLRSSEVFAARITRVSHNITRLADYSEVRWYSLFQFFDGLSRCKDEIISFYVDEGMGSIAPGIWETVDILPYGRY